MSRPDAWIPAVFLLVYLAGTGCQGAGSAGAFDWTVGTWEGIRRDVASGSEAKMVMRVEPLLGGIGQIRALEIEGVSGVYRGTAVQQLDQNSGEWFWQYTNSVERPVARYAGEVAGESSTWSSISPGRTRDSRLISELLPDGTWRRSMSVSTDGARTWTGLWVDELRPAIR